jgi:Ca2+-binding EF-hand superfamily protein
MKGVRNNILLYKDTSELKRLALNVIARKSTGEQIMQLRKAFDQYDTSNDGLITFEGT